jgi:O-antigen ligase
MWLQRLLVMAALALLLSTHLFFIFEGRLPEPSELLGPFASLFGKSADLTGRADIWAPLLIEFDKHWLLGIGYGAFWLGPGSPSQPVLDTLQWIPLQAHNGYLDVLNELGVIGGIFFLGFLAMDAHRLSQLVRVDRNAAAFFSAILGTLLISNISESSLFRGVSFNFLLLILSSVRVGTMLDNE